MFTFPLHRREKRDMIINFDISMSDVGQGQDIEIDPDT